MNGLLVIDKPGGITSRAVVNRCQRWFPKGTKLGHTGTLDPLATGVLVLCVGAATRLADLIQGMGKSYRSRFRLGATSDTDDADGVVSETVGVTPPTDEQVRAELAEFVGLIEQLPPAYSALKVNGRRAHDLARRGNAVPLTARPVRVEAIRLLSYDWPLADVEVDCGKGTYIRSLARDVGARLGVGGLVQTLRRTRVGPFTTEQVVGLAATPEEARAKLLPMAATVQGMVGVKLDDEMVRRIRHGQRVRLNRCCTDGRLAVFDETEKLVAIGETMDSDLFVPSVVLPE